MILLFKNSNHLSRLAASFFDGAYGIDSWTAAGKIKFMLAACQVSECEIDCQSKVKTN